MATLKEEAKVYEPQHTLNIAELEKFPIDLELHLYEGTNDKGEAYKYKYVVIDGKNYRVPWIVLSGIKALLPRFPSMKYASVIKSGNGKSTEYQVIPYTQPEVPINEEPIKG